VEPEPSELDGAPSGSVASDWSEASSSPKETEGKLAHPLKKASERPAHTEPRMIES
jgi:hypothetical protein